MAYKKSVTCGRAHPTRPGVACWGKDCELEDQHWAYIKAAHDKMLKVTWRLQEEPK